jgi:glycosyltransferase involved in cell wall biosynthesis
MRLAVIVTTYEWPEALRLCLEGLRRQTDLAFELIVADDGSGSATAELIRSFAATAPFAVRHVWQEDKGYRAAAIRNRAIAASDADYLLFTDGDSIPLPGWVAMHRRLACPGWMIAGGRALTRPDFAQALLAGARAIPAGSAWGWLGARLAGGIDRWLPMLSLPGVAWRKLKPRDWRRARTGNLSLWRSDILRVNGFDESFEGWGHEDADLAARLVHAGVRCLIARFGVPVVHLWHPTFDRGVEREHWRWIEELAASQRTQPRRGLREAAADAVRTP